MQSTRIHSLDPPSTKAIVLTFDITRHPKSQAGFETNSIWQELGSDG